MTTLPNHVYTKMVNDPFLSQQKCMLMNTKKTEYYVHTYDPTEIYNTLLQHNSEESLKGFDTQIRTGCANVISIIFYVIEGTSIQKYVESIYKTIINVQNELPDWIVRIYFDTTAYNIYQQVERPLLIEILGSKNTEIYTYNCGKNEHLKQFIRMYRFFPLAEQDVNVCVIREADGIVTNLDCHNIRIFAQSNKMFYVARIFVDVDYYNVNDNRVSRQNTFVVNSGYQKWLIDYKQKSQYFKDKINLYDLLAGTIALRIKFKSEYFDKMVKEHYEKYVGENAIISKEHYVGMDETLLLELYKNIMTVTCDEPIVVEMHGAEREKVCYRASKHDHIKNLFYSLDIKTFKFSYENTDLISILKKLIDEKIINLNIDMADPQMIKINEKCMYLTNKLSGTYLLFFLDRFLGKANVAYENMFNIRYGNITMFNLLNTPYYYKYIYDIEVNIATLLGDKNNVIDSDNNANYNNNDVNAKNDNILFEDSVFNPITATAKEIKDDDWNHFCTLINTKKQSYYTHTYDPTTIYDELLRFNSAEMLNSKYNMKINHSCANVISIMLYIGKTVKTFKDLLLHVTSIYKTVTNVEEELPDWIVRVYLDGYVLKNMNEHGEQFSIILTKIINSKNVEIYTYKCEEQTPKQSAQIYRFVPFVESNTNICIVRDAGGIVTRLDCHNIRLFAQSNKIFYIPLSPDESDEFNIDDLPIGSFGTKLKITHINYFDATAIANKMYGKEYDGKRQNGFLIEKYNYTNDDVTGYDKIVLQNFYKYILSESLSKTKTKTQHMKHIENMFFAQHIKLIKFDANTNYVDVIRHLIDQHIIKINDFDQLIQNMDNKTKHMNFVDIDDCHLFIIDCILVKRNITCKEMFNIQIGDVSMFDFLYMYYNSVFDVFVGIANENTVSQSAGKYNKYLNKYGLL